MEGSKLSELVRLAKGDDRTLREYARDSGVDAAVISKIISGKYVPQKFKIYEDLTSMKAAPRGGVTCEQLLAACSTSYKVLAGQIASEAAITMLGGLPAAVLHGGAMGIVTASNAAKKKKKIVVSSTVTENLISDTQRFSATAMGIIYGSMAQKGIVFRPERRKESDLLDDYCDTYVHVENQYVKDYIFKYIYLNEEDRKSDNLIENISKKVIEQLIFLKPDSNRKISIVINCSEVYDYFYKFKGEISYRGNLSIILIDVRKVCVEKEDYLSFYYLDKQETLFIV